MKAAAEEFWHRSPVRIMEVVFIWSTREMCFSEGSLSLSLMPGTGSSFQTREQCALTIPMLVETPLGESMIAVLLGLAGILSRQTNSGAIAVTISTLLDMFLVTDIPVTAAQ